MATVTHSTLTDPYIHEPKGAAAAGAGDVYVADGAGSGDWRRHNPHGGWRYNDIGTGTTYTAPTTYTLMDVAGSSTGAYGFSPSTGRLTYTDTPNVHLHFVVDLSFKHSTGAGQDVYFAIYKNGAIITAGANAEMVASADSGNYQHMAIHADSMAVTNDYFDCYLKCATGNVIVHSAYMFAMGMPA
jgi:hypothetical protein